MRLVPVTPGSRARLRNSDAMPPRSIPNDLEEATKPLMHGLRDQQEMLYAEGKRSLLVVLQGRDAAGKDGTVKHICGAFNPQGTQVTSFKVPVGEEATHDYLWRIHRAVPRKGLVGVFNRSQYEDVLVARVHNLVPRAVWSKRYAQINDFERMLTENGVTIVKFFLHVSRAEQARRIRERAADPTKQWKVSASDVNERRYWQEYTLAYQDVLSRCSTPWAPWYVVPADDKKARDYLVAGVLLAVLQRMKPAYPPADRKLVLRVKRLR
jgi:PPK2 family polyphosphate:nucleotide phosphotransferase